MYLVVAEERGIPAHRLGGTSQNDILKEYVARGTYIYPPDPSIRLTIDMIDYCAKFVPKWNPISVSGYHMREAGASAAQELAFTLGNAIDGYYQPAIRKGLDKVRTAQQLSFFFSSDINFFEEIAKFRAARRMWAHIVRDDLGIHDERAQKLRFHVHTGGSVLTQQEPDNNLVRVAYQSMAAVLGGCQSLHNCSKDEALGLPTEDSVRTALRTHQILAHETGITEEPDPLGGSFYIETLTDALEEEAREILGRVRKDFGGMREAIASGAIRRMIGEHAYVIQRERDTLERKVVGVNFPVGIQNEKHVEIEGAAPCLAEKDVRNLQIQKLDALKRRRSNAAVSQALGNLERAANNEDAAVMPLIVEAVRQRATIGEISTVFRNTFGEYHPPILL